MSRRPSTIADEHFLPEPTTAVAAWLIGAGRIRGKNIAITRRRDRFFTLVLVTKGTGWFSSASLPRTRITAGQALALFPGEEHSLAPDGTWDELWVMATGSAFRALEAEGTVRRNHPILEPGLDEELLRLLGRIVDEAREHSTTTALAGAQAYHAWCLAAARDREESLQHDARTAAGQIKDLLESDLARPLIPAELSAACGMSWERLRKAFAVAYGAPPARWQRERRIAEAKHLLTLKPDLDLTSIARRLGFADAPHFSHRFQAAVGTSPGAWRKHHRCG